jgi:hypothetical protein
VQFRKLPSKLGPDSHPAGNCVALLLGSRLESRVEQRISEAPKGLFGNKILDTDETVSLELLAHVRGDEPCDPVAAMAGERMRSPQSQDVKAGAVEPA